MTRLERRLLRDRTMKVIASSTRAERSSGQVMRSSQPWISLRIASTPVIATAAAAATRLSPATASAPSANVSSPAKTVVAEKLPAARSASR